MLTVCKCGCGSVIDTRREGGYTVYVDRVTQAKTYYVVGHTPWDRLKAGER